MFLQMQMEAKQAEMRRDKRQLAAEEYRREEKQLEAEHWITLLHNNQKLEEQRRLELVEQRVAEAEARHVEREEAAHRHRDAWWAEEVKLRIQDHKLQRRQEGGRLETNRCLHLWPGQWN